MVLAVGDARHSAAWLLPLLCLADLFAIAAYRRHAHARRLFGLLPWVLGGIALGAITLAAPERALRLLVAAIVIVMIALRWLRGRGAAAPRKRRRRRRRPIAGGRRRATASPPGSPPPSPTPPAR